MQLGSITTLAILNAAVRQRQLAELHWLSEPVETPPKKVYPMHAILAIIGFQTLQNAVLGGLVQIPQLSSTAVVAIAYCVAAFVVTAICWTWMSENHLAMPTLSRGPALRPILIGLSASCVIGLITTMFFRWLHVDHQMAAYAINGRRASCRLDKWCLLGMWVVAAPLFEEWIIRGLLYRSLRRTWGIGLSVAFYRDPVRHAPPGRRRHRPHHARHDDRAGRRKDGPPLALDHNPRRLQLHDLATMDDVGRRVAG